MTTTIPVVNPPRDLVMGSIEGVIYEQVQGDKPSVGATVSLYDKEVITDALGRFEFSNVDLFSDGTFLTVEKDGFFGGSREFNAIDGELHNIEIRLIEKVEIEAISSQIGGVVGDGMISINLPSGIYNSAAGAYNGEIRVFAKWLDPTTMNFLQTMPGQLVGIENQEDVVSLSSWGMLTIEIEDENGNALSLPDGLNADISIPVSDALVGEVPSQVGLWYYDNDNSIWLRNGVATLSGNEFNLTIDRFSYWNLSESFETTTVTGSIFIDNEPLVNRQVRIRDNQSDFISFINTSEIGTYSIGLPVNQEFILDMQGECLNTNYEGITGPFLQNTSNNDIQLSTTSEIIDIQIVATDCSGSPLANSQIGVKHGGDNHLRRTDEDGLLRITIEDCLEEPIEIVALDLDNNMISESALIHNQQDADIGAITTCDNAELSQNILYDGIDWSEQLMNAIESEWKISVIDGLDVVIFNLSMSDSTQEYMHGAIRFEKEDNECDFLLTIPTQGFRVSGICTLQKSNINNLDFFRFHNVQDVEILEIDSTVFPQVSAQSFEFDLTYFD